MRIGIVAGLFLAVAAQSAAAAQVRISFEGTAVGVFDQSIEQTVATNVPRGSQFRGEFTYNTSVPLQKYSYNDPFAFGGSAGVQSSTAVENLVISFDGMLGASTIRYEGFDTSLDQQFSFLKESETYISGAWRKVHNQWFYTEYLSIGVGGSQTCTRGSCRRTSIFSEMNDQTGSLKPFQFHLGFEHRVIEPDNKFGLSELDYLLDDYSPFINMSGVVGTAGLTFEVGNKLAGINFAITKIGFDRLDTTDIPEPGTLVLAGAGILGLIAARRGRLR